LRVDSNSFQLICILVYYRATHRERRTSGTELIMSWYVIFLNLLPLGLVRFLHLSSDVWLCFSILFLRDIRSHSFSLVFSHRPGGRPQRRKCWSWSGIGRTATADFFFTMYACGHTLLVFMNITIMQSWYTYKQLNTWRIQTVVPLQTAITATTKHTPPSPSPEKKSTVVGPLIGAEEAPSHEALMSRDSHQSRKSGSSR
jgi:hypothetical protein